MGVDSFKFLPRIIARFYRQSEIAPELPIPWTPLTKPLNQCKFGLVTSAGLYIRDVELPFDLDRERREKTWGDPSFRRIPLNYEREQIGAAHLHINTRDLLEDINISLPIDRFKTIVSERKIKSLAQYAYSFMGFQGYPPNTTQWASIYGPAVASELQSENVDCVFLTTA